MTHAPLPPFYSPQILLFRHLPRCLSSAPLAQLRDLLREPTPSDPPLELAFVSALKSCSSVSQGEQLQSFVTKSGLDSNVYVQNSLINLRAKCGSTATARRMFDSSRFRDSASWNIMIACYARTGDLGSAHALFGGMVERDCVSFTTMIMGLAQNNRASDALRVFQEMQASGVSPNEVTLASVISACSWLQAESSGKVAHAASTKNGLDVFVLVSTNLVHMYAGLSCLNEAERIFYEMTERNIVSWNVMLNAYSKSGLADAARGLFDRISEKDLVSWSTMVDAYVRTDRIAEALVLFREMRRAGVEPNEVTIVDLLSACGRSPAIQEGWQFHGLILKNGLDCHVFLQTTVIHFYAGCDRIQDARRQFGLSCKDHVSPWNALIAGFVRNNMIDSARDLFDDMPARDVVSWSTMISGYVQTEKFNLALNLFRDMVDMGLRPNEITMVSVVSAIAHVGILKQGRWVHEYIQKHSIPLNDNLIAGLVDMYAKCGSIHKAVSLFYQVESTVATISPWNAVICGLAMHGLADEALNEFFKLVKTGIKPNSVTFIGVLSACCHAGLVKTAKLYFEKMKNVYKIEPTIKHYGCMVDLLGRAGRLEEAERLISSMPMEADVVIWGSILAACRTHANVEIGERAASNLARLEPGHGAGRVLLSNMYAEAGKWDEVASVRKAMKNRGLKKVAGCSGVV